VALAIAVWRVVRDAAVPAAARRLASLAAAVALLQVALGITTLLLAVPVGVAVLHQGGAVALLTVGVLLVHALRSEPVSSVMYSPGLSPVA
jgi:cytochrome c oxidase assembly protein subunit 15